MLMMDPGTHPGPSHVIRPRVLARFYLYLNHDLGTVNGQKSPKPQTHFSGTIHIYLLTGDSSALLLLLSPTRFEINCTNLHKFATMAGQKRNYKDYGGHQTPRTLAPNASSSRRATAAEENAPLPPSKSARKSHGQTGPMSYTMPAQLARASNSQPALNTQPARTASGSSQHDPLVIDDDDDEDDASQEVQDSSQSFSETDMSYVPYGVWEAKIVGVRFYNGHATVGEIAIPRREPHNQYDRK